MAVGEMDPSLADGQSCKNVEDAGGDDLGYVLVLFKQLS